MNVFNTPIECKHRVLVAGIHWSFNSSKIYQFIIIVVYVVCSTEECLRYWLWDQRLTVCICECMCVCVCVSESALNWIVACHHFMQKNIRKTMRKLVSKHFKKSITFHFHDKINYKLFAILWICVIMIRIIIITISSNNKYLLCVYV